VHREGRVSGLPLAKCDGEVMYVESPRKVGVIDGKFNDWFAPFEVTFTASSADGLGSGGAG